MAGELNQALMEFKPDDYSVRLVENVLGVLPGAPAFHHWPNLAGAVSDLGAPSVASKNRRTSHRLNPLLRMGQVSRWPLISRSA